MQNIWIKLTCSQLFKAHNKILSLQGLSTSEIQTAQKSQDYILILIVKYDTQLCNAAKGFMSFTLNLFISELKKQDHNNKSHPAFAIHQLISLRILGAWKMSIASVACYFMYTRTENTTYISGVHHSLPAQKSHENYDF